MQPLICIGSLKVALDNLKMVWASRDNGEMMLEVILEAWVEKIEQKYVFLNWKHKILIKLAKNQPKCL